MSSSEKPFAQTCENNKRAIADVLAPYLRAVDEMLEIGSGTGQHAVYFADRFPDIQWQTSDLQENHSGIQAWIDDSGLSNVKAPLEFDLLGPQAALKTYPAVYLSNVVHIVSWASVLTLFDRLKTIVQPDGLLFMYGPYNYGGRFTSDGNRRLDEWLKSKSPEFGIRDFEQVDRLAREIGLVLLDDHTMPANNRTLVWRASR